jgi:hypothetical protein
MTRLMQNFVFGKGVICPICGVHLEIITSVHLWKHDYLVEKFVEKFPDYKPFVALYNTGKIKMKRWPGRKWLK